MRRAAVLSPDGIVSNVIIVHDEDERIPPGLSGVVVLSRDDATGPGWVSALRLAQSGGSDWTKYPLRQFARDREELDARLFLIDTGRAP